jgi:hypothetical protein
VEIYPVRGIVFIKTSKLRNSYKYFDKVIKIELKNGIFFNRGIGFVSVENPEWKKKGCVMISIKRLTRVKKIRSSLGSFCTEFRENDPVQVLGLHFCKERIPVKFILNKNADFNPAFELV